MPYAKIIPILFTFDNNYAEPAAVAFFSLLNKADKNNFYELNVIHSDITQKKQEALKDVIKRFDNARLNFISRNEYQDKLFKNGSFNSTESGSIFTSDSIVKCFAAGFLPQYDKIIYSDVDIIVVGDISEIYDINIEDKYLAGVKNPFMKYSKNELSHLSSEHYEKLKDSYIAGGIWLMNLKKIRQDNIESKIIDICNDKTIIKRWPDQDLINIACLGKISFLPLNYISYPYMMYLLSDPKFESHYSKEELYDSIINPKIIHFASEKPWNGAPEYANLWWTYFNFLNLEKTNIFDKKCFQKRSKLIRRNEKLRYLINCLVSFILVLIITVIYLSFWLNKYY